MEDERWLNDSQLLLLDCLVYSDITVDSLNFEKPLGEILQQYINDPALIENVKISGGISKDEMMVVIKDICEDEKMYNMKIGPSVDDGIRGTCFLDEDGHATVAFRGTGGTYKQWYDNNEGFGEIETVAQRKARKFIENLPYNDIDVTGDSKGGNLSKFVTIVCGYKIHKCLSVEGQGFSKEFKKFYAEQLKEYKEKITQVSGKYDKVDGNLIEICPKNKNHYVKRNGDHIFGHGVYEIYLTNKESMSRNNGMLVDYVEPDGTAEKIRAFTRFLSEHSDTPFVGPALEFISDYLGNWAGIFFGFWNIKDGIDSKEELFFILKDSFFDYCKSLIQFAISLADDSLDVIKKGIDAFCDMGSNLFEWICAKFQVGEKYAYSNPLVVVDTYSLKNYADRIKQVNETINSIDDRLDSLYWRVGLLDIWNLMCADALTGHSWRLDRCARYLYETADEYEKIEKEICGIID